MLTRLVVPVAVASLLSALVFNSVSRGAAQADAELALIDASGAQWQIPAGATRLSVLAVGGGGGGAPGLGNVAGGGGAGGLVYVDDYLATYDAKPGDVIAVHVGLPGPIVSMAQGRRGHPGENSSFGKVVALGGGGGGRGDATDGRHGATSGGSAGGGVMATGVPVSLQPNESGFGVGFGHPGGGTSGSGGGGAGGPGTRAGAGGVGLQGIPRDTFINQTTGHVTSDFDATDSAQYRFLFRDVFGPGVGDDGWFAGGGAYNAPKSRDRGGRGGGSSWDARPHTGGGGGGSTHGYQGGEPGLGGSGVVLIRCEYANGSVETRGWGRVQPDEFVAKRVLREPGFLCGQAKYDEALESLDKHKEGDRLPTAVQVEMLRLRGQVYAGQGREAEALATFKKALELERTPVR